MAEPVRQRDAAPKRGSLLEDVLIGVCLATALPLTLIMPNKLIGLAPMVVLAISLGYLRWRRSKQARQRDDGVEVSGPADGTR